MSMLAEGRRKQKISTNPNGLLFASDESGVAQKLMQQMGWEKGKGLGANSQGEKDPIKVRTNVEGRGLGCKRADVDKWIAHQDDFNSLLANLNEAAGGGEGEPPERSGPPVIQNLEAKSKSSRSRVHYMKFTKGKDLSRHSEKDLACVLGPSRSENRTPTAGNAPNSTLASAANSDDGLGVDTSDPFLSDAQHVTSTLSLQEYFASKMAAKRNGSSSNLLVDLVSKTPSPVDSDTAEASEEAKPNFFIGETGDGDEEGGDDVIMTTDVLKAKKKKRKEKVRQEVAEPEVKEEEVAQVEETEEVKSERRERRRLKKRLRREKERRAELEESARHKTGGKTKPKPADDTMKFVSESSSAEDENSQQTPTEKTKNKRKHAEDTTEAEGLVGAEAEGLVDAEASSGEKSLRKRKLKENKIRKSKSDSDLLEGSSGRLAADCESAETDHKPSKRKNKKGLRRRSKEL